MEELQELFERWPMIQKLNNKERRLKRLRKMINDEADLEYKVEFLEEMNTTHEHIKQLVYQFIIEYAKRSSDNFDAIEKITQKRAVMFDEVRQALEKERKENTEVLQSILFGLIENPVSTVEALLNIQERQFKIDGDGQENLQWTLRFNYIPRLKMACKLIFGA
ncbi:hypothetical protein [Petroclostridium sp. X23]|uniref:hypothetical protein n=1 Tax=Petroclostridium sp. X23 TaxID=3045146 RepID=UPI0024AD4B6D|nr:hypothetical protein [Petroclostridium sp. X23]WHH60418.1 hypothetical protein QKW49_06750 [Petroclostridium sp. X23]